MANETSAQVAPHGFVLGRDSLLAHAPSSGLRRFRRRGYQRYRLLRSNVDLSLVWKRRWFILSMMMGFTMMSLPTPEGLTHDGMIVLAMSFMATVLFIRSCAATHSAAIDYHW